MGAKLGLNPWWSMWVRPKKTMEALQALPASYRILWLLGLYGFNYACSFILLFSLGHSYSAGLLLGIALVAAIPVGALTVSIMSALLFILGKLVGGKGSYARILSAAAWSCVGYIPVALLWLVAAFLFGRGAFIDGYIAEQATTTGSFFALSLFLINVVALIWVIVMLVNALGVVQRFSAWMGLLNLALAATVLGVVKWIITMQIGS